MSGFLSDFENVLDVTLKNFFYLLVGIAGLLLLGLPFILLLVLLASEGFWALIAPEMLARGLTDAEDSWHGLIGWAFRVPGVAFALLALPVAWLAVRILRYGYQKSKMPQKRPPTDLPAAAVSLLKEREVKSRTLLTIVLEMCQRGTLEVTGVREAPHRSKFGSYDYRGEYEYRTKILEEPLFSWERTVCDALPKVEVSVSSLASRLEEQKCDVYKQIDSYLRDRGLFHSHPMAKANPARRVRTLPRLGGLLLFTGLVMWLFFLEGPWVVKAVVGFMVSFFGGFPYFFGAVTVDQWIVDLSWSIPNGRGRDEIGRWKAFREHLKSVGSHSADRWQSDELLPYAVALDCAEPWLLEQTDAPVWFQVASTRKARDLPRSRHRAYHGLMSSECWDLNGRSKRSAEWAMELFYSGDGGGGVDRIYDGGD